MFAMLLLALVALAALTAIGVLADSGLRWWSAFDRLRQELKWGVTPAMPRDGMRPTNMQGGNSGFGRPAHARPSGLSLVTRVA